MRRAFAILRLALALVGVVALVGDYLYTLGFRAFSIQNFFAYFTTQSNMVGVVVLALSGLVALARDREPRWLSDVRGLVLAYIVVSGIVFGLIAAEANTRSYRVDVPWSSAVLHFWIPSLALLDWVLAPGRRPVRWRIVPISLGFPVVWGVITLIRGSIVGWYPYFFLDPGQVDGLVQAALYDGVVLALIAGITAIVAALSRVRPLGAPTPQRGGRRTTLATRLSRRRARETPPPSRTGPVPRSPR